MTIKQLGGVFGRNPTFNNVTIEGTLTFDGDIDINSDLTISGNLYLPDNSKAIFGTGSDLQIYHDGLNSYITDNGTGDLIVTSPTAYRVRTDQFQINNAANTAELIQAVAGGAVKLRHNGSLKLATTATGIDVTGSVTADGLTVNSGTANNVATFSSTDAYALIKFEDNTTAAEMTLGALADDMVFRVNATEAMRIDSLGRVGIGMTANTGCLLNVNDNIRAENSAFLAGRETAALPAFAFHDDTDTGMFNVASNILAFSTAGVEAMRIDSSGHAIIPAGVTLGTSAGVYDAAKTLDDYEEGAWTPTLEGAVSAGSYSVAIEDSSCKYTKVGRQVTVTGRFTFTVSSAGSSYAKIGGLPFATSATNAMAGAVRTKGIGLAAGTVSLCTLNPTSGSVSYFAIGQSIDNANSVLLDIAGISSTDQITVTLTYFV